MHFIEPFRTQLDDISDIVKHAIRAANFLGNMHGLAQAPDVGLSCALHV